MKHLWLVEDDPNMVSELVHTFENELGLIVSTLTTEEEFRKSYQTLAATNPPAVVVLDVMFRWTKISSRPSLPPIECRDYQRAGLRCKELLMSFPPTATVPLVFYSFLDSRDIESSAGVFFSTKRSGHRDLIAYLKQLLDGVRP